MKIELYSKEAAGKVTFEFDSPEVTPTEALAKLFAEAIRKLLAEHPWKDMPPLDVAIAWSLASIIDLSIQLADNSQVLATELATELEWLGK